VINIERLNLSIQADDNISSRVKSATKIGGNGWQGKEK